jgi:hypothetical protein
MNQPDRRIFHRLDRDLPFRVTADGEAREGFTVNTSVGGALLDLPMAASLGDRLELGLGADESGEASVVALVHVVHVHRGDAGPEGMTRVGARWIELYTDGGEGLLRTFLERILGMVNLHVEEVEVEGVSRHVFRFPSLFGRTARDAEGSLADLLEPQTPLASKASPVVAETETPEASGEGVRVGPDFSPIGKEIPIARPMPSWASLENSSLGAAAKQRAGRAPDGFSNPEELTRQTTASTRAVPRITLDVHAQGGHWQGVLTRIGYMSLDLTALSGVPRAYTRVNVLLPIPSGPREVTELKIAGAVTRIKDDGRFTVRISRVDEGGHEGLFQAFVSTLLDDDQFTE